MTIKILLADEHPVVFEGITKANGSSVEVMKQISRIDELVEALSAEEPDVLVTEVRLNGQDALKAVEEVKRQCPDLKVVVYSGWKLSLIHI